MWKMFLDVIKNIFSKKLIDIYAWPRFGSKGKHVEELQKALNKKGASLIVDGIFGEKTKKEIKIFQGKNFININPKLNEETLYELGLKVVELKDKTPWMTAIKKDIGKKETDELYASKMVAKWPIVGLNLKTISTNWAAWCGLAVAVYLKKAGLSWRKDGALAKNWKNYGLEIDWKRDGIPYGAIVHVNKYGKPQAKGNHVTFSFYNYSPTFLSKKGAAIQCLGGNQNNKVKVSPYKVSKILNVRWPDNPKYPKPIKINKSDSLKIRKNFKEESTV